MRLGSYCGRRAGKSFTLALVAVFLAAFRDWRPYLDVWRARHDHGDRRRPATGAHHHAVHQGPVQMVPMLAATDRGRASGGLDLSNRITIEVHTARFRTVRGYTIVAALLDELAFWRGEDSSNPDDEIISAIKPAMATIPERDAAVCVLALRATRRAVGELSPLLRAGRAVLVWQAPTRTMNPTVPQSLHRRRVGEGPDLLPLRNSGRSSELTLRASCPARRSRP